MHDTWWSPWNADEHCRYWPGSIPLLISLPHDGSEIPAEIAATMQAAAQRSPDTDWQVSRLYDFARGLGAHVLRPRWSRYVIDLNRPPDGAALYPGRRETGLCPTLMFSGEPVYTQGREPDADAVGERVNRYWRPYHDQLSKALDSIRTGHGRALLWEGHSIRSQCPMFFDGRLPDYNVGTADGASCAAGVQRAIAAQLQDMAVSHVINGRFRGGYITRHYGQPERQISAVQMEMAQDSYLDEGDPERFDPVLAEPAQAVLRALLTAAVAVL
jgi:N-formylglutamate deformylase